jgi:hypothetical protein
MGNNVVANASDANANTKVFFLVGGKIPAGSDISGF